MYKGQENHHFEWPDHTSGNIKVLQHSTGVERRLDRSWGVCPPPGGKQGLSSVVSMDNICGAWIFTLHGSNEASCSLLVRVVQKKVY